MRKILVGISMVLLFGSALPAQAAVNSSSSRGISYGNYQSPLIYSQNFWYNRGYGYGYGYGGYQPPQAYVPAPAPTRNPTPTPTTTPTPTPPPAPVNNIQQEPVNDLVEKIIATGKKYMGTPYEFGSDRNSTKTFDCSAFVRQVFKESADVVLPMDSRKQGVYVRDLGNEVNQISKLKRGDLMFFMDYKGSKSKDYAGINKSAQTISHVGIYLGDGKILHTHSTASGGVRIDDITDTEWEYRFLFGGSALE